MEKERYDLLLKDTDVLKIDTIGGAFLTDLDKIIAIQFLFAHNGIKSSTSIKPEKRVYLSFFPFENLIPDIKYRIINDSIVIIANADTYEYALAYTLTVNRTKKELRLVITEMPNIGEAFITKEEKTGIALYY